MGAKVTKKKKDEKTAEATGVAGPATKVALVTWRTEVTLGV